MGLYRNELSRLPIHHPNRKYRWMRIQQNDRNPKKLSHRNMPNMRTDHTNKLKEKKKMKLTIINPSVELKEEKELYSANIEICDCSYGTVIWIKPDIENPKTWIRIPEKNETGIIFKEVKQ